jgi:D-alanyl-D-alanine carboxypeptidase
MYRTSFANPHGLANVLNFSTAKDMLELCKYACGNKDFRKIMNTEVYEC